MKETPKIDLDISGVCYMHTILKLTVLYLSDNDEFDREEIPTYEEVARLFPRPGIFRPIVLIGAPGVGRNELKRRLMALEPERYKATIPRMC